jgi:hypothetical protein
MADRTRTVIAIFCQDEADLLDALSVTAGAISGDFLGNGDALQSLSAIVLNGRGCGNSFSGKSRDNHRDGELHGENLEVSDFVDDDKAYGVEARRNKERVRFAVRKTVKPENWTRGRFG